ncbi:hypothetical protein MHC_02890 [Mycoplasma haemocanis str. Illinois]|uniref:Uncharacterized protein n=1 Tax=Mycoplasma haemocanis (strain Illinois) TaxID=1111676 RepID=H6N718_MYCHN|nr:hypothetical protein [Mycoplasma haemocanis]AEW45440.1 hypothetical protein MHC_02890 [Mycoplasma haemocanis str. Illinois]
MTKTSLVVISSLGTGAVGVGGYYSYHSLLNKPNTLLSRIQFSLEKHKKILSSGDKEWSGWTEVYKASSENKISGIDSDGLSKWCETILKSVDETKLDLASTWCVINTRTLLEEISSTSKTALLPLKGDNADAWGKAWEFYDKNKTQFGLAIEDSTFKQEATDKAKGTEALKKWCSGLLNKKMYEPLGSEVKAREKVEKWCSSNQV